MRQSVGTSAACGLPIAAAGALGFAWFGQDVTGLPEGAIGFVHVIAFVCIAHWIFYCQSRGKTRPQTAKAQTKKAFGVLLILEWTVVVVGVKWVDVTG